MNENVSETQVESLALSSCFHLDSVQHDYVRLGCRRQGLHEPLSPFYIQEILAEAASFSTTTLHTAILVSI